MTLKQPVFAFVARCSTCGSKPVLTEGEFDPRTATVGFNFNCPRCKNVTAIDKISVDELEDASNRFETDLKILHAIGRSTWNFVQRYWRT